MKEEKLYLGYDSTFLIDDVVSEEVHLPILGDKYNSDVAPVKKNEKSIANYLNFSLQISKSRKFAIYTATNIDGDLFKKAVCPTSWKKDSTRIDKNYQWGYELYTAPKSDFDKGHMTKREDVQWGGTMAMAQKAVDSTFYYTNAVPQYLKLNQKIWKRLENYILHTETKPNSLKVCVFTGPVLSDNDPNFVTEVRGQF